MKKEIYIGVDTGVETGFAYWHSKTKKMLQVTSLKIHVAMETVLDLHKRHPGQVKVRIEDARLRKWIPRQKNERAESGRREGAGSIKRDAIIWEDFCTDYGIDFELVPPKQNKTKVKADYFKKLTGWTEKTNSHGRDAAMLVFGY